MFSFKPKSPGVHCLFAFLLACFSYQAIAQTPASTSATNPNATWLTETSLKINWTIPNLQYDDLIVVGKAGIDFADIPTGTNYTANANFTATGNDLFGGKVVYAGVGASVTVTKPAHWLALLLPHLRPAGQYLDSRHSRSLPRPCARSDLQGHGAVGHGHLTHDLHR